ncbi:hypothetical protein CR513_37690, partial [Mucuna pruriens]
METSYGIWKLHPIHVKTPNLLSLRQWGSCLKGQWHRTFEGRYGNLLSLLEIEVQPDTLSALTQYYDPPLKCFTFRDFQLAPTMEEYERIVSMPLAKSPPNLFKGQYPSWASATKLLGISELEVWRERRNKNGLEGISRASRKDKLDQLQQEGKLARLRRCIWTLNAPKDPTTTILSWCQDKWATPWLYPHLRKPSHLSSYTTWECRTGNALRRFGKLGGVLSEKDSSGDPRAAEPHLATRPSSGAY